MCISYLYSQSRFVNPPGAEPVNVSSPSCGVHDPLDPVWIYTKPPARLFTSWRLIYPLEVATTAHSIIRIVHIADSSDALRELIAEPPHRFSVDQPACTFQSFALPGA